MEGRGYGVKQLLGDASGGRANGIQKSTAAAGPAESELPLSSSGRRLVTTGATQTYNLTGIPSIALDWQWGVLDPTGGAAMTPGLTTTIQQ